MREEVFLLAYGGLHWSPDAVLDMPTQMRAWFVDRLLLQKDYEKQQMDKS